MKDILLGKDKTIPLDYDPSILTPLSRLDSRIKSGLEGFANLLHGIDYWTSYETSWLNPKGIPRNGILNIAYSCNSKFYVESKSLKLYLYSLNNKKFDSVESLKNTIRNDLENILKTEVDIDISDSPRPIEDTLNLFIQKLEENKNYSELFKFASKEALQNFKSKQILIGRARMFNEKTKELDDPGMYALSKLSEIF